MIHVIEVEVTHEINITTKKFLKPDIALHLEIDLVMTKVLLLHNTLDHDKDNYKRESRSYRSPIDLLIDLLSDPTLVIDKDHAHIQEIITTLQRNIVK